MGIQGQTCWKKLLVSASHWVPRAQCIQKFRSPVEYGLGFSSFIRQAYKQEGNQLESKYCQFESSEVTKRSTWQHMRVGENEQSINKINLKKTKNTYMYQLVWLWASPSVCPHRRGRHVRTSKNIVFCGIKCTCPWSWLSSCNAQLSYLCVECYTTSPSTSSTSSSSCKVQRGWEFIFLIPLLIFPIECKVQRGWEFIFLMPLLIFPIECKVQRVGNLYS